MILDPPPAELAALLERRRTLGLDRRDEVWEGVLHMMPPPSHAHEMLVSSLHRMLGPHAEAAGFELTGGVGIGVQDDYRVPDLALHRPGAPPQWHPTAALVVEVVSPNDESWQKLPFYGAHGVDELLIVDPQNRTVDWLKLEDGEYHAVERSALIDLGSRALAARIDWPAVEAS